MIGLFVFLWCFFGLLTAVWFGLLSYGR